MIGNKVNRGIASNVPLSVRKHYWLYVLKLQQGKYYVGITTKTPEVRFVEHKLGRGAGYTRKYGPLSILDTKDLGRVTSQKAERYENKVTRAYMNKDGYNNVRGGDLSDPRELVNAGLWYFARDDWRIVLRLVYVLIILLIFILVQVKSLLIK